MYQKNYTQLKSWIETHPEEAKRNVEIMLEASHAYWKNNPDKLTEHMELVQQGKYKW